MLPKCEGVITYTDLDKLVYRNGSGDTIEILDIYVNSDRGKGIGTYLVYQLLSIIPSGTRTLWAITRVDNTIGRKFYRSLGFYKVGNLYRFYNDDRANECDAIVVGLDCSPEALKDHLRRLEDACRKYRLLN